MQKLRYIPLVLILTAVGIAFPASVEQPSLRHIELLLQKEASSLTPDKRDEIAESVLILSEKYQIDPILILAIMKVESRFQISARSHRDALGLMQVRAIVVRDVADDLNIDPKRSAHLQSDIRFNLLIGVHYLARLFERFHGDLPKALMAYNRGPTAVALAYHNRTVPYTGYQKIVLLTYARLTASANQAPDLL